MLESWQPFVILSNPTSQPSCKKWALYLSSSWWLFESFGQRDWAQFHINFLCIVKIFITPINQPCCLFSCISLEWLEWWNRSRISHERDDDWYGRGFFFTDFIRDGVQWYIIELVRCFERELLIVGSSSCLAAIASACPNKATNTHAFLDFSCTTLAITSSSCSFKRNCHACSSKTACLTLFACFDWATAYSLHVHCSNPRKSFVLLHQWTRPCSTKR